MTRTKLTTNGFTLIELLVVMAIIGVLIALVIPGIQRIRESASRVGCANNLRQIGLALHNYQSVTEAFPPASTTAPGPRHSWVPFVLPYLEQGAIYDQYDQTSNWYDAANQTSVSTPLQLFQCPATPVANRIYQFYDAQPAYSDYNATKGISSTLVIDGLVPPAPDPRGVLVRDVPTRIADILDGTSNTILIAEDAGRPDLWVMGQVVPDGVALGGGWADDNGPFLLLGSDSSGMAGGPCPLNCTNISEPYSFHPGGANFLLADGSVRFLDSAVNIAVMAALVTRAGGEDIPGSDL
jgi:prepilin-type N-terminal cleavage/methylation domain-containing protein/prepilin-type processing-associated H-X9-DG protein